MPPCSMARALPLADTLARPAPAEVESIPACAGCSGAGSTRRAPPGETCDDLTLAAAEAAANAIEHAYGLAAGIVELHAATVREAT